MTALQAYQTARELLISQERARSHHHLGRPHSDKETHAIQLIETLRSEELSSIWDADGNKDIWLGMPFTASKELISKQSTLFALIKQMPKAALLHCHLDAMNDPRVLLRLAFQHPNLLISSSVPLLDSNISTAVLTFSTVPLSHVKDLAPRDAKVIFTASHAPQDAYLVSSVRAQFPGGAEAFDKFVIKRLTVDPSTVDMSPTGVWAHFQATFHMSAGLINYEPVWEAYIYEVFKSCASDSVPYLECRINFLHEFISSIATGTLDLPHRDWVRLFANSVEKAKKTATPERPFWGAKVIYTTIRFILPGNSSEPDSNGYYRLRWYMEDCIKLKLEFPDLIAGFDLVGWEDGLESLEYYMEDLLWFKERQKECGVEIPYLFHAGETVTDGGKADMNLYDAVLLDTKRIGHGFSLPQHPLLMEICRERKIAVECCPISNELLRYTANATTHPLSVLLNNSIPVSLSCDDPQFFGNYGLSYDFYQVFTSCETMNIVGLGQLARKSISYTMMDPKEIAMREIEFDAQFEAFLDIVVDTLEKKKGSK